LHEFFVDWFNDVLDDTDAAFARDKRSPSATEPSPPSNHRRSTNPVTTGFHDHKSGALFTSDCFGALLQDVPENAADLTDDELRQGQVFWATIDSSWLHNVDTATFAKQLNSIREIDPTMVFSSHLPAAPGTIMDRLLASLEAVPAAQPFVGPDQGALGQLLADMITAQPR
jgi:hypothetical protein